MRWDAIGRDAEDRPRQITFEAPDQAAASAHVRALGWKQIDMLSPRIVEGQVVADAYVPSMQDSLRSPRVQAMMERAAAEPSALRRAALDVPAQYLHQGPKGLILPAALVANVLFAGPLWLTLTLAGLFALPAVLALLGGRATSWYQDYRWAIAKHDWPTALDRAAKLSKALEPNLAKCHVARALAGAGELDRARALLSELEVSERFTEQDLLMHRMLVLTEGGDARGALEAELALLERTEDPPSIAQGVAMRLALTMQDGEAARPYLELASKARGRGRTVDVFLDLTESVVRYECAEREGLTEAFERLIPEVEAQADQFPETYGLGFIARAYACLLTAESDPERAAAHFRAAAPYLQTSRGLEHLLERCSRAVGVA